MNGTSEDRVGIREVARLAEVSPATVSRVLNDSPTVAPDRRERVLDAVSKTGYRPNRLARNLRRQKTDTIGVVVSDIDNPHFGRAVSIFERVASEVGYGLLLCSTDETVVKQRAYLRILADERVQGVIISPADSRGAGTQPLLDSGIPIVAFDRSVADPRADAVIWDNVEATRRATEHLIWLGHKQIAYVGGRSQIETGAERLEGYASAMRNAQLTPLAVDCGFRGEVAEARVQGLLVQRSRPTALVIANNLMALGALRAIKHSGLCVPTDVALVAVDDPPWAEVTDPPLTVVAQPLDEMARTAVDLLFERIQRHRVESRRMVFPLELRIRSSCGMRAAEANEADPARIEPSAAD